MKIFDSFKSVFNRHGGNKMKSERKYSSIPVLLIFLASMFAGFVDVVPFAEAALGSGKVLSYKPNVVSTGFTLTGDNTLKIQFKNDATDAGNCIDEILIMAPDNPGNNWTGTAVVTGYDRSSFSYTNEESNDDVTLVGDSQSVRIVPSSSLCPGETVNIEIDGLIAPSSYEVSDIVIKTSDLTHNAGPNFVYKAINLPFPKITVTKGTQLKVEYLEITSFSASGFMARSWGAWARLNQLGIDAPSAGTLTVSVNTGVGPVVIFNAGISNGKQWLTMNYASWPALANDANLKYGYLKDQAGARQYNISFIGGPAPSYIGVKSDILNDDDYISSGLSGAKGTIITANSSESRKVLIQLVDDLGYNVKEAIPLVTEIDPTNGLDLVEVAPYTTGSDGIAKFTLKSKCLYGVHEFTVLTDPLKTTPEVTEYIGVDTGAPASYSIDYGDGTVPADEDQLIEVTVKDSCGNVISNTNQLLVQFDYLTLNCPDALAIDKLADVPGDTQNDHHEEQSDMGIGDVYLMTECYLCTHDIKVTVGSLGNKHIYLTSVPNLPEKMLVNITEKEITADQCVNALIQVTDSCGNLVSEIPSEVGDEMEQWESIVRVTVDKALIVDQPKWAPSSQTYIADSDFREEQIYNGGDMPYVQGKLNDGEGHVKICGCQGLGVFQVVAESDTIEDGKDEVGVKNAAWDCIETTIADSQLLSCEKDSSIQVAIKDICGNYMRNQECGTGKANYCVDLKLKGSCGPEDAHLSTSSVCVNVGTGGPGYLQFPVELFRDTEECCELKVNATKGVGCCGPYPNLPQCEESSILFHGEPDYMTTQFFKTRKICGLICPVGRLCVTVTQNNHEVFCYEQLHEQIQDGATEVVSEEVLDLFTVYDSCGHIVKDFDGTIDVEKKNEDCASIYQVDHPLTLTGGWCEGTVLCKDLTQFGEEKCRESNCDPGSVKVCAGDIDCDLITVENHCKAVGCEWSTISGTCGNEPVSDCGDFTVGQCETFIKNYGLCELVDEFVCQGSEGTCGTEKTPYTKEQCAMVGAIYEPRTKYGCTWIDNCNREFENSIIKKLVIHNCAPETEKQWLNLEVDDIMVDKLAFYIDHEVDPSLWVEIYMENENTPGFQPGEDKKVGMAPLVFGGPTIIEIGDVPYPIGFFSSWYTRGWYDDDQREGGVLIRAGDSRDFYVMLVSKADPKNDVIPCGTYSAQFLYYEDYTAMDYTEFGCGDPDPDGDGVINVDHCSVSDIAIDTCMDSDNFNYMGKLKDRSACGSANKRGDSRNDDYRDFDDEYAPTPDYGFGDTYLVKLPFKDGQAWTKQRDLTAETVKDYVSNVYVSGETCPYEESEIELEVRPNPETITFIPQPATQVIAINHDGWDTMDVGCGTEAKPANDQSGDPMNYFRINLQTADGFQNPVGKDIDVALEYCLKAPFGDWMIEDVVKCYCKKVEHCKENFCDIEECEMLWRDEDHCYTKEELKELMKETDVFGEYFGDVIYDEFLGAELNAWIDSYFENAKVHFWKEVSPGNWQEVTSVKTDLNGQAQVAVTSENPGFYKVIARPYALDADYTFVSFGPGVPTKLDVMAVPSFGVPADGEEEAIVVVRALDQCGNMVLPGDYGYGLDDVTVSIDGKQTYISQDFECKNNHDNSVSTTAFQYDIPFIGATCLRVLSDYPQTATITASGAYLQSDTTQIKFQGAPVKLAITKIEPSDRLPADGKTGAWVTIQVQDMLGNRVTGYLGNGFSGDPGDPWGMTDYVFNNICIDMDDALADYPNEWGTIPVWFMDIDDATYGWIRLDQMAPSMYCGDLMFGEGKIYVTLDNPDGGHGGTVQVKVYDKEQFQCQEINENGIPSSVTSTQCKPAMGEIDFVDPASQWNIWSDKQIVLADGKSKATISVQIENEYMDVRQAVDGNVYIGGTAAEGAKITWKGMYDKINPTSMRMVTDPMTGRTTLELSSTEPGVAEITVVGGRSYVCMGIDDITLTGCMESCFFNMGFMSNCLELCLSGDYGFYNQASGEEYLPKRWCGYSASEQLTPKTITVEFVEVAGNQVYLDKGWNFISTPFVLTNKQVNVLFNTSLINVTDVYKWDAVAQNFVSISGSSPIEPLFGYWIKMGSPGVITLKYATPAMPSIPTRAIKVGWETFGLSVNSPITAENALISVDSSYSLVIDWAESQQKYDLPVANTGENGGGMGPYKTGGYMAQPKQGYWLWVKTADTLAGLSAYSG
jgi:hypothetical protein